MVKGLRSMRVGICEEWKEWNVRNRKKGERSGKLKWWRWGKNFEREEKNNHMVLDFLLRKSKSNPPILTRHSWEGQSIQWCCCESWNEAGPPTAHTGSSQPPLPVLCRPLRKPHYFSSASFASSLTKDNWSYFTHWLKFQLISFFYTNRQSYEKSTYHLHS